MTEMGSYFNNDAAGNTLTWERITAGSIRSRGFLMKLAEVELADPSIHPLFLVLHLEFSLVFVFSLPDLIDSVPHQRLRNYMPPQSW